MLPSFKLLYILANYSMSYLSAWPCDRARILGTNLFVLRTKK